MFSLGQHWRLGGHLSARLFPNASHAGVRLRGLNEEDWQEHADHLKRLGPRDRHSRFQSGISDAAIERYVRQLDWHSVFVFGVFVKGRLRAAGELIPMDLENAELSVSVETEFQHSGFGKMLMLAMFLAARRLGIRRLHIIYSRNNDSMAALARDLGARTEYVDGLLHGIVTLPPQDNDADAIRPTFVAT